MDNNKALTDNELVRRYHDGDVVCFNTLLDRHQAKVYGYIFSVVKHKDMADEIFQETFYKVIETICSDQYNYEGKIIPWVIGIAHNLIMDQEKNKRC